MPVWCHPGDKNNQQVWAGLGISVFRINKGGAAGKADIGMDKEGLEQVKREGKTLRDVEGKIPPVFCLLFQ